MHAEPLQALDASAASAFVRAVVVTGAGRGCCAGPDPRDPAMTARVDAGDVIEGLYRPLATRLRSMPVAVIAAVDGAAAGAGAKLAFFAKRPAVFEDRR